nr:MAG TPA: tail tape measure protein [Caudoviricetes sp.]
MSDNTKLQYGIVLSTEELDRSVEHSVSEFKKLSSEAESSGSKISESFKNIGAIVGVGFSVQQAYQFINAVVKMRGEIESLEISFQTLLGSKEKADELFGSIRKFAASTPMMLKDLAAGAQTMLGFNIEAEKVMPMLKAIGDIAMGDSARFNSLTLAFSQMSATGKLMGQDLLQMINAGFNPLATISEQTGKSISELKDEMSKGAISAEMIQQAFLDATAEGGKFYNMLEKQSHGMRGALSNLQGAWDDMLNDIGTKIQDITVNGVLQATELVKHYEDIGKVIAELVGVYGTYRAALMVCNVVTIAATEAAKGYTLAQQLQYRWSILMETAQKALNKTMLKNPYVAVAAAVTALTYGVYKLLTATSDTEKAMKRLDKAERDVVKEMTSERAQVDALFARLKAAKQGTEEYNAAKSAIMSKYGEYLKGLGDEKTALNDIALAYKTITEKATEAAKARAYDKYTTEAADDYGESIGKIRERVKKELEKKYKGQTDEDGVSLAETYYWKIVPVLEGTEEVTEDIQTIIDDFEEVTLQANGMFGTTTTLTTNSLESLIQRANNAKQAFDASVEQATIRFGNKAEDKPDTSPQTTNNNTETSSQEEITKRKKAADELAEAEKEMWFKVREAELGSMAESTTLKLRQIELDKEQTLAAIDKEQKALEKKAKEAGVALSPETYAQLKQRRGAAERTADLQSSEVLKSEMETIISNYGTTAEKIELIISQMNEEIADKGALLTEDISDENKKRIQNYIETLKKQKEVEIAQLKADEVSTYGNTRQKRTATEEFWEAQIAAAPESIRAGIEKAFQQAMAQLNMTDFKAQIDWDGVFGNLGLQSAKAIAENIKNVKDYLTLNRENLGIDEIKELETAISNMYSELEGRNPFMAIVIGAGEIKSVKNDIVNALNEYNTALTEQSKAEQDFVNQKAELDKQLTEGKLQQAEYDEQLAIAEGKVGDAEDKVKDKTAQLTSAQNRATTAIKKMYESCRTLAGQASGIASNFAEVVTLFDDTLGQSLNQAIADITDLGESVMDIVDALAKTGENIVLDLQDTAEGVSQAIEKTSEATSEAISAAEAASVILLIVKAVIKAVTLVFNIVKQNTDATQEYEDAVRQLEVAFERLNDAARLDALQGVFGDNNYGKLKVYTEQLREAANAAKNLSSQFGSKKTIFSWGSVLFRPFDGIASSLANIKTIQGDLIADMRSGWQKFWGSEKNIVKKDLADFYDEQGNLNVEELKAWYDQYGEYLDSATKSRLEALIEEGERQKEALDGLEEYATSIFGNMGADIADVICDGILAGKVAFDDLEDIGLNIIDKLAREMAQSFILESYLNNFKGEMQNALMGLGEKSITDVIAEISNGLPRAVESVTQMVEAIYDSAEDAGMNIDKLKEKERETLSGSGIAASQESVDNIDARMTTMQSHTYSLMTGQQELIATSSMILQKVSDIEQHTGRSADTLDEIKMGVSKVKSAIDDISLKGIKMK